MKYKTKYNIYIYIYIYIYILKNECPRYYIDYILLMYY